jgi:thiol-disulfide isomerase/thioredoxin
MMPVLIAAVAVVGFLCALDLLLTFGVIRRLREHTTMLTAPRRQDVPRGLLPGELPAGFSAVTTDGGTVTGTAGVRLVAFFAVWCSVCPERVPSFLEYVSVNRIARDSVLAVVADGDKEAPPYLARLEDVARVSVEPSGGAVSAAFKLESFPTFILLDSDGAVQASGWNPAELPAPAAVPV